MTKKPRIELKPMASTNQDTIRILENLRKSIENLNVYVDDFIETMNILNENLEKAEKKKDTAKADEIRKNIVHIQEKMEEVTAFMKNISGEMSEFVDYKGKH